MKQAQIEKYTTVRKIVVKTDYVDIFSMQKKYIDICF